MRCRKVTQTLNVRRPCVASGLRDQDGGLIVCRVGLGVEMVV